MVPVDYAESEYRMLDVDGCSFCRALSTNTPTREVTIVENDCFVAWVSRGALVEGHLLVVPRSHALNLRQMDAESRRELWPFLIAVKDRLAAHYGPICLFEHGPVRPGSPTGCSIDHAHMHLLPWSGSLIAAARNDYPNFNWRQISSIDTVLSEPAADPYLLVQDDDGEMALATHPDIPSQALRRTVSGALARGEEWDWKEHPQLMTVRRTIRHLVNTSA